MAPKYHPTPLSGGDRKALTKELGKARAMTGILASQSVEMRAKGQAMIQQADRLLCESWNERMWSDGEAPNLDPSETKNNRRLRCPIGVRTPRRFTLKDRKFESRVQLSSTISVADEHGAVRSHK